MPLTRTDEYVSKELMHFVGRGRHADEQFEVFKSILTSGWLTHPPHENHPSLGVKVIQSATFSTNEMINPEMICFCDILPHHLRTHTDKYGQFGIGFPKRWLAAQGANPVMYVASGSGIYARLPEKQSSDLAHESITEEELKLRSSQPLRIEDYEVRTRSAVFDEQMKAFWEIWYEHFPIATGVEGKPKQLAIRELRSKMFLVLHVLGFIKVFDETLEHDHPDNFYMEREWRRLGNLHFAAENVSSLLVPSAFLDRARDELPAYAGRLVPAPEWT